MAYVLVFMVFRILLYSILPSTLHWTDYRTLCFGFSGCYYTPLQNENADHCFQQPVCSLESDKLALCQQIGSVNLVHL